MAKDFNRLIVIGCSSGGKEAVGYIIPRIEIGSNAVIIASHVNEFKIYKSLDWKVDAAFLHEGAADIEPGKVFILNYDERNINRRSNYQKKFRISNNRLCLYGKCSIGFQIDDVMRQAAENFKERCIGVILSGYGDDGKKGMRYIKDNSGSCLVQIEDDSNLCRRQRYAAKYIDKMPYSAINALHPKKADFSGGLCSLVKELKIMMSG